MKDSTVTRLYTASKGYIDFDYAVPCLIDKKLGFLPSEEFRPSMEFGLQLIKEKMKEYPAVGWIANLNQANVFDPEDRKWMIEYWNPTALEAGLKYVAFIMPESDFVRNNLGGYIKRSTSPEGFTINSFMDIGIAKTWLRSQLFNQ